MGYYLTPQRDVGVMGYGTLGDDLIHYGLGVFNGDGRDDATGGDVDAPEMTGRLVISRSRNSEALLGDYVQVGGSFSYARIDRNNVGVVVKTAGMTPLFTVASRAKFNIIRDVDTRKRYGAELAWVNGPVALMGEYMKMTWENITTSSSRFTTKLEDTHISLLYMVTGERPRFSKGILQPLRPYRSVGEGFWGGLGLACRYDAFRADEGVYDNLVNAGDSIREADAYTITLNWYLDGHARVILDATRTTFDRPLLIDRDALTGAVIYSDQEEVLTLRFQFAF